MISFHCQNCNRRLKIADAHAGRKGQCPRCGATLTVPLPPGSSMSISRSGSGLIPSPAKTDAKTVKKRPTGPRPPFGRSGSGRLEFKEMIDMTAMVDIVFFLLIFFMLTSFNSQQASIEMPAPAPPTGATGKATARRTVEDFEKDGDFVVVRIDADDTVWVEEAVAMTPIDVAAKLRQATRGSDGPQRMLVVGHSEASHGAAVMVMDAGHSVGIDDVRLAVKDDD
jgi:biopolymer transport protein ExbD